MHCRAPGLMLGHGHLLVSVERLALLSTRSKKNLKKNKERKTADSVTSRAGAMESRNLPEGHDCRGRPIGQRLFLFLSSVSSNDWGHHQTPQTRILLSPFGL